jgi:quaternary ammonium compound-resistance protein SugE
LAVAGLLEVVWATSLKYSEGFTKLWPSVITLVAMAASMWLLGQATKTLPMGTAYGVWVGIGAVGTAITGVVFLGEPVSAARVGLVLLLLVAIIGLKLTAPTMAS